MCMWTLKNKKVKYTEKENKIMAIRDGIGGNGEMYVKGYKVAGYGKSKDLMYVSTAVNVVYCIPNFC